MTSRFDRFLAAAGSIQPRFALVLGSGLGDVSLAFQTRERISFGDIPGLVAPTVEGHRGEILVGNWNEFPAIVCLGRVHFYEGHELARVVRLIHLMADLGVRRLLLTNAAGGIHDDLAPGKLMAIRQHIKFLDRDAWRRQAKRLADPAAASAIDPTSPYDGSSLLTRLAPDEPPLLAGTYAALTGPCYETPAEIRMLRTLGADAVGMSTALEAEAAAERGLEVAGLSVITNRAAGLAAGTLSHKEVGENARLAITRLARLVPRFFAAQ